MGIGREYKLIVKNSSRLLDKRTYHSLSNAMYDMLVILKQFNSIESYLDGVFVETINPINRKRVVKRYKITLLAPYTEIIIIKLSTGSLNDYMFIENFKKLKEIYFDERI